MHAVLAHAGFKRNLRWQDIQARFTKMGLTKPVVSLIRDSPGLNAGVKGEAWLIYLGYMQPIQFAIQFASSLHCPGRAWMCFINPRKIDNWWCTSHNVTTARMLKKTTARMYISSQEWEHHKEAKELNAKKSARKKLYASHDQMTRLSDDESPFSLIREKQKCWLRST